MPCAGKTGTTNDHKDGWLAGYTRYYTTSVWVGYDMPKEMDSLMGNTYPGKIWQTFMEQAHEGLEWLDFLPYTQIPDASSGGQTQRMQRRMREAHRRRHRRRTETRRRRMCRIQWTRRRGSTADAPASLTGKRAGDIGYAGCHTGTAVRRSAAEYNRNVTGKCIRRIAGKCSAVIRGERFGYAAGDSARGTLREYTLTLTDKTGNVIISMGKGIGRVHNGQKTMQGYK